MIPVETSPIAKLTIVTATSMMFIGSRSCARAIAHTDGGFSAAIRFGPDCASRSDADAELSPSSGATPCAAATSSAGRVHQSADAADDALTASATSVLPVPGHRVTLRAPP